MKALVERHKDDDFQLLGINTGDDEQAFREGMQEHELTWPIFFQGMQASPIADLYQVVAYPTIYVLDREGKIRSVGARGPSLDKLVAELLAE